MAQALVPIKSKAQWIQFLKQFDKAFDNANAESVVVISDQEKGLPAAFKSAILNALQSHCCQHIADNVQQRFGIKCQPLFYAVAQARSKDVFKDAL